MTSTCGSIVRCTGYFSYAFDSENLHPVNMALEPDTSGVHQFEDGSFSDYSEPLYGFKMGRNSISCFWSKVVGTIALNTSA